MNKVSITFGDADIKKCKFHYFKFPINKSSIDINDTITFYKVSFDKTVSLVIFTLINKNFINYKDDEKVKPKLSEYVKSFNKTKYMSFL